MGGRFLEALLFAVSSLALYSFGAGRVLFLVPLQVLAVRRGPAGMAAAGGIALLGLVGIRLAAMLPGPFAAGVLLMAGAEVAAFLLLVAGLAAAGPVWGRTRALVRLLASSIAVCLLGAPIVTALAASPEVRAIVDGVFAETAAMLRTVFATGDSVAGTVLDTLLVPATLQVVIREYLLHGFVPAVFGFLAFSWWAGSAAGRRAAPVSSTVPAARPWRFAALRLEAWWLWPLIVSLALVLAVALLADTAAAPAWLPIASYAAWNAALVMLFLFGLQGLAILRFLLEKRGIARLVWPLVVAAVAAALATPRLNLAAAVALPLFGASENWVRYRRSGPAPA